MSDLISTVSLIIGLVVSLVVVIALYIFVLPDSKRSTLNKPFRGIHDFLKIKSLMIESIFRFFYVSSVVSSVVIGFITLFDSFGEGLLLIILGPIISRIIFEMLLLGVILVKNVMEINNYLKGTGEPEGRSEKYKEYMENMISNVGFLSDVGKKIQNITTAQKQQDDTPSSNTNSDDSNNRVCKNCGRILPQDSLFCVHCGTRIDE